jgi:hypothetical protein
MHNARAFLVGGEQGAYGFGYEAGEVELDASRESGGIDDLNQRTKRTKFQANSTNIGFQSETSFGAHIDALGANQRGFEICNARAREVFEQREDGSGGIAFNDLINQRNKGSAERGATGAKFANDLLKRTGTDARRSKEIFEVLERS